MFLRTPSIRLRSYPSMSSPSKITSPSVGSRRRRTRRARVLLPHPDSPTSPSVSPRRTERSTPSTAFTCPTVRCNTPALMGKCIFKFLVSSRYSPEWPLVSGPPLVHAALVLLDLFDGEDARGCVRGLLLLEMRVYLVAFVLYERTAGTEVAPFRKEDQARRRAFYRQEPDLASGIQAGQ